MSDSEGDPSGEMTLAFELDAIRRFEDPAAVFADAREWCRSVGVVANDTDAVASFVAEHDLSQDFDLGDHDVWLAMEHVRQSNPAPRHVFVGTTAEDRRIADATGWEFRRPSDVADAAGWSLASTEATADGLIDRIADWFSSFFGRHFDG